MTVLFLLSLLFINKVFFSVALDCNPIAVCQWFQQELVPSKPSNLTIEPDLSKRIENETEIARSGSMNGVEPDRYKLQLNFLNRTHYTGSVDIMFKLNKLTNIIMINQGARDPTVYYNTTTITRVCLAPYANKRSSATCIEKAIFLQANETVILQLTDHLEPSAGVNYVLSIPSFHGRSEGENGAVGATGLFEATVDGLLGNFSATTTIFQMRYARTVFPCFDHPALKARFDFSIERPAYMTVASNTRSVDSRQIGIDRKRDRFGLTPKISTYIFAFALMENYTSESFNGTDGRPIIEILAPIGLMGKFRWMFYEAKPVVQYFEKITKRKFPLERLAFIIQYPAPFWGVENFGLVTVEGGLMQAPSSTETAYVILYHEIVHQWLGNTVTISEWREICLQEGLTAYFEWNISAERRNGSLNGKVNSVRKEKDIERYYEPYALRKYKRTQDIANWCYGRPSVYFHAITTIFGFEAVEQLLAKLIHQKPYRAADISQWDRSLVEVTGGPAGGMSGYIERWFLEPGPVYVLVSKGPQNGTMIFRQHVAQAKGDPAPPQAPRPIPLKLFDYGWSEGKSSKVIILNSLQYRVSVECNVCLVDPDGLTMTRIAYTSNIYSSVLYLHKKQPNALTDIQVDRFVDDFCKAMMADVLPLSDDPASTDGSVWLDIYGMMKNYTILKESSVCRCCMNSKEENEELRTCLRVWNGYCQKLRLTEIVGYNYTFSHQDIWGG